MTNLKDYFFNTNNYSDPEIKKFIYDFTDKFNPFLLIALNKQFVIDYLTEMDKMNEWKVKDDNEPLENLIAKESLDKTTNVLCRIYSYCDDTFKIEEVEEKFYNLNYSEHMAMTIKIQDFRYCMQEIILWLNSKNISQSSEQLTSKITGAVFNRNNWNENTYDLFNYLDGNYEKNGKIKFVNIFKFLKNVDKKKYAFNFTEAAFREYILNLKSLKIGNFITAEFAYEDKELPILNSYEEAFRKKGSK